MNKRAVFFALLYSAVVIGVKLFIVLGGYALSKFGFFYSHVTLTFLIILFYIPAIKQARDRDYNGIIGGRECMRIALTVFAISAVLISIYNYFEFEYHGKFLAVEYYNGQQFLDYLKSQPRFKPDTYSKIISQQVTAAQGSAFRSTTGKLFSMMLIGLAGAFIVSMVMKRSPRQIRF
jgi:hypothetical protein